MLCSLNINEKKQKTWDTPLKVGMSWPLENDKFKKFSRGMQEVLVVEEKEAF